MIRLLEASDYRCLRRITRRMDAFHVLVGPNASGKSTFLDVIMFLADLVSQDVEETVGNRAVDFRDLVWGRSDGTFELAVELDIPESIRENLQRSTWAIARYEVSIGAHPSSGEVSILAEKVLLKESEDEADRVQDSLFPEDRSVLSRPKPGSKTIVNKVPGGNDNFYDETGKGWDHAFRLGPRKSALKNLPEDESKFPAATWLKKVLSDGIQRLILNSLLMRAPSPPGYPRGFRPDGSNLPWVVEELRDRHSERFTDWIEHLQTALPDLRGIRTVLRPEDRQRYLVLSYANDVEVPSWVVSDGTLRLLALTLLAYLPDTQGAYLIEEPENGIHPRAIETMFQSLSSVYDAQILLATHSPVMVGVAELSHVLCFTKDVSGATSIVPGPEHPALKHWKGETNLGGLFAGGVLG